MRWDVRTLAEFVREPAEGASKVKRICKTGARSGVDIVITAIMPVRYGMVPVGVGGLFPLADAWSSLTVLEHALGCEGHVNSAGYSHESEKTLPPIVHVEGGLCPRVSVGGGESA